MTQPDMAFYNSDDYPERGMRFNAFAPTQVFIHPTTPAELRDSGYGPIPEFGDTPEKEVAAWVVIGLLCLPWLSAVVALFVHITK